MYPNNLNEFFVDLSMIAIENNPFRVIGVLANAKEKDIQRQKVKTSRFLSVGKNIKSEYDYDFFAPLERTEKLVADAFSDIDQRQDKLEHSLFWFVNCNQFDEIALTHLSDSNQEKALLTWSRVVDSREITPKLTSCLNNYSTLKLHSSCARMLSSGIANKLKLIQSKSFPAYVAAVTDDSFVVDRQQLSKKFIKRITQILIDSKKTEEEVVDSFSLCDRWVKDFVAHGFCENLIFDVERAIDSTKKQRKQSGGESYELVLDLSKNTINKIKKISALLGSNNIKFRTISDAIAQEISRCDVAYFNAWQNTRPVFDESLELLKHAQYFATNEKTKREIQISTDDMLERQEQHRIGKYYDEVHEELGNFTDRFASIDTTIAFINTCKPKLKTLISEVGQTEGYMTLSSVVVRVALNAIIDRVNEVQDESHSHSTILSTFKSAHTAMNALSWFDMNEETQARFDTNHTSITNSYNHASAWQSQQNKKQQQKQQGCYIATMAYGDYDHPQVMRLRQFRDQTLAKTWIGRTFIKVYYKYSPLMVRKLNNNHTVNRWVRSCLDGFIKQMDRI